MSEQNFLQRLKQRKLVQWAIAYVAAAFALLQGIDIVAQQFGWPEGVRRGITLALVVGFFVTLVIAWYHGERGMQRVSGTELLIIGLVLAVGGGFLWRFAAGSHPSDNKTSAAPNESPTSEPAAAIPEKSIAVLPFDSLSEDKSNAFFAEGVQDEILTRLAKVADLKVIARTSTKKFQSAPENLPDIAKQLGVMNILEGSVQKSNDQVRVNVQLINALTSAHLWAEIYDRKLTDIFTVESEIAKTIADTLQAKLSGSEKAAISSAPTENSEAYQLYLQGKFFWSKRTAPDLRKSIDYFNEATAKDPHYALAHAAAAQSWVLLPAYDGGTPVECFQQAEAAAKKALVIDENLSDAHAALGAAKSCLGFDFTGAIAEFERALKLNPNDSTAHHWLGNHPLTCLGQLDRAMAEIQRARELDPLSLIINANVGYTLIMSGKYDEAIAQLRKTLDLDGRFYFARYLLGWALELKGSFPEALAEYKKAAELSDDIACLGFLGHLYGKMGRRDEAQKILDRLLEIRKQRYTEAYYAGLVYLGLGNKAEALRYFEQSYHDRDGYNIGTIRVDPSFKELRGDPRFEALAEKIVPARGFNKAVSPQL
jgi:TolB-like protein/Flp pilus assembly protein TadD